MKECPKCETVKSESAFGRSLARKSGLQGWCKVCRAKQSQTPGGKEIQRRANRKYRQSHKEENAERRRSPSGREAQRKSDKKQREKFPERTKAINAVNNAITAGKLERPLFCEECGEEKFVQGHHEDYINKPLDVDWLCIKCHVELHRKLILV